MEKNTGGLTKKGKQGDRHYWKADLSVRNGVFLGIVLYVGLESDGGKRGIKATQQRRAGIGKIA